MDCEIELHRSLARHPAIVRFEHAFEDEGSIYIITEFCPGSTLFKYLQDNHPTGLPEDEVRPIFLSLTQAVSFLHQNDVLHRDLKLTNVLLTDTRQVRIADFGLATKLEDASLDQEMTMCGTPNYISPEIVRRDAYGMASDIWSLGCMLVALLTGRPPFQGDQISETLHLVSKGAYRPLPRSTSRDVRHLVETILQVDPRRRPTTSEILTHPFLIMSNHSNVHDARRKMNAGQHQDPMLSSGSSFTRRVLPKMSPTKVEGLRKAFVVRRDPPCNQSVQSDFDTSQNAFNFGSAVKDQGRNPWAPKASTTYSTLLHGLRNKAAEQPRNQHRENENISDGQTESRSKYVAAPKDSEIFGSITNSDSTQTYQKHFDERIEDSHENEFNKATVVVSRPTRSFLPHRSGIGHRKQHSAPFPSRFLEPLTAGRRYSSADVLNVSKDPDPFFAQDAESSYPSDYPGHPRKERQDLQAEHMVKEMHHNLNSERKYTSAKNTRFAVRQKQEHGSEPLRVMLERLNEPFQSGENMAASGMRESTKSGGDIIDSVSSSYDLVDKYKFSTAGLKPCSQRTKHGEICLLENGDVTVVLTKDVRQYAISSDGNTITVTSASGFVKIYSFDELPAKCLSAYRYASKFIRVLHSKVVKIALDSDLAKCRLYQNDAFEVILVKQQCKVTFEQELRSIKIATHDAVLWKGKLDVVPSPHREHVRQALIWWARCKDALKEPLADVDFLSSKTQAMSIDATESGAKFIDGLGWCEKHDGGKKWNLYFLDGVGLEIDVETRSVRVTDVEGHVAEHKLEAGLTNELRQRLKAASRGMQQFVDNNV